jgi:hypothetical protein
MSVSMTFERKLETANAVSEVDDRPHGTVARNGRRF